MPLHLLKPGLHYLRSTMPMVQQGAKEIPRVERLRGSTLQAMRARVYARAGQRCECPECMGSMRKLLTWATFELDHVVRVADGGDNSLGNFRAVHVDCHARITARQNAEVQLYGTVLQETTVNPTLQCNEDDMPC